MGRDASGEIPLTASAVISSYTGETYFGRSLALSDTHLVVGAYSAKKVFLFKRDASGEIPLTASAVILSYTGETHFGYSLALSATHLVVSASGAKKVFLF